MIEFFEDRGGSRQQIFVDYQCDRTEMLGIRSKKRRFLKVLLQEDGIDINETDQICFESNVPSGAKLLISQ
jgi:hypothetical protein